MRLVRPLHQLDRAHRAQGALIDHYGKLPNGVDTIEPRKGGPITYCGSQPEPVYPCYLLGEKWLTRAPTGTDRAFVIEGVLKQVGMASKLGLMGEDHHPTGFIGGRLCSSQQAQRRSREQKIVADLEPARVVRQARLAYPTE
ncbi:MAG: hypothetical protein QOJ15_6045 [Bradyrhizobium sp.]|nr:hypothetical protein [Bradyrhizobium sp.]